MNDGFFLIYKFRDNVKIRSIKMSKKSKQIIKVTLLTIALCLTILVVTGVCSLESAITSVLLTGVVMSVIFLILTIVFIITDNIEQKYKNSIK